MSTLILIITSISYHTYFLVILWNMTPQRTLYYRGEVGRFDHLTLQWFYFSICDTRISKNYFSVRPLMFNVPNKAMITWFVTQFNVVNVIYISKVAEGEVRLQCGADQPHMAGIIDQICFLIFLNLSVFTFFLFMIHISAYIHNTL